jgi:amino acid transporter
VTSGVSDGAPAVEPAESESASHEKAKLRRHFGRIDIFFFLVCTLVGVDGLGALSSSGGAGFTWLLVGLLLFAVPSALILSELGAAYTGEGGPYLWVRYAFGHLAGAVNNFFYWVSNPVWMGGLLIGSVIGALSVFMGDGNGTWPRLATYVFGVAFIWVGVLFAIVSFRIGKWIATVGAIARIILLGFFAVIVVAYGLQHGFHGVRLGDFRPTFSNFVLLVPLVLFALVGFELPNSAGDEMVDAAADVPSGIGKSLVAMALLYGIPVLCILLVLPTDQVTGLTGFPDAVKQAMTVLGGQVTVAPDGTATATLSGFSEVLGWGMGVLIAVIGLTYSLTWIMGSDRTLAVSCYDGAGPRWLGTFSERFGTPVRVNVLSGVVATVMFVATSEITGGDTYKFFQVALSLAVSTTLISYLGIFPAAWRLRRTRPLDERPFRSPALGLMTVLTTLAVLFCTIEVLFPGLGDDWFGPDYRPDGWQAHERWVFLLTESVPLVLLVLAAVLFWHVGVRGRRQEERPSTETGRSSLAVGDGDLVGDQ